MKAILGAIAALAATCAAVAQPTYVVNHCVELGPVLPSFFCVEGEHEYGTASVIPGGGGGWAISSPAPGTPAVYTRSVRCDFTGFNLYWRSTITISGITPPVVPGSATLLVGGQPVGSVQSSGDVIEATFLTSEIMTPIPEPTVVIAWSDAGVCYPDCTGEGVLTIADFACFQGAFAAGGAYADCTADGVLSVADFACFQSRFVQGCP